MGYKSLKRWPLIDERSATTIYERHHPVFLLATAAHVLIFCG